MQLSLDKLIEKSQVTLTTLSLVQPSTELRMIQEEIETNSQFRQYSHYQLRMLMEQSILLQDPSYVSEQRRTDYAELSLQKVVDIQQIITSNLKIDLQTEFINFVDKKHKVQILPLEHLLLKLTTNAMSHSKPGQLVKITMTNVEMFNGTMLQQPQVYESKLNRDHDERIETKRVNMYLNGPQEKLVV